jgi:hypothetical protein
MKRVRKSATTAGTFHKRRVNTSVAKPAAAMKGYPSTAMGLFSLRMVNPVENLVEG